MGAAARRKSANTHSLRFFRGAPSDTPSLDACVYSAPTLRFSRRAITVVFVFSRARVLSVRMSSFVQSRRFTVFFAIYVLPCNQTCGPISGAYVNKKFLTIKAVWAGCAHGAVGLECR